jgi:flagellar protein FlaI
MQTGHPAIFTFHAGNISALINRFTGDPINIPEKFFDNLNIAVFQNFIKTSDKDLRRVTEVHEIEGYSDVMEGLISRKVFQRNVIEDREVFGESVTKDKIEFIGYNNSYFLEEKAAPILGYEDPREIYSELEIRTKVIERANFEGYTNWEDSLKVIRGYERNGEEGLPFDI